VSEFLPPPSEGPIVEESRAIPGTDAAPPTVSVLPSAYKPGIESLTIVDLTKITVSEAQESYMENIGHLRLSTQEEDASYVHFDADDLVVISGIDDDVPLQNEDSPVNIGDLVDDDVLGSEHLLR
jgi:hypothetical protein